MEKKVSIDKYTGKLRQSRGALAKFVRTCAKYNIMASTKSEACSAINIALQAENKERKRKKMLKFFDKINKPECSTAYLNKSSKCKTLADTVEKQLKIELKRRKAQSIADKTAHKAKISKFKETYQKKNATNSSKTTLNIAQLSRKERRVLRISSKKIAMLNAA